LMDGLFAHPADSSERRHPGEPILLCCATIEFFRSLLESVIQSGGSEELVFPVFYLGEGARRRRVAPDGVGTAFA
jgi:hypothetical protein